MYINENALYYENISLLNRKNNFKYNYTTNTHIKSTIKGNLSVNYWKKADNPHSSKLNITSCDSNGKIIPFDSVHNKQPDFSNARLKHFYYKSFEEYCIKLKRGNVGRGKEENKEIIYNNYKRLYFGNINNTKKMNIIHNI